MPAARTSVAFLLLGLLIGAFAQGADIRGIVVIDKKLTARNVTPAAGSYQRGVAVDLAPGAEPDPLAFERSHVAVYIDGAARMPTTGEVAEIIQQNHRHFEPDFVVAPAGSAVSFPNFDPIFHNVFSLSKAKSFDLGNYSAGQTRTVTFPRPGIVFVNCHLHPNMAASVVVSPTPWFTRVGADGVFEIKDVPTGKYTLVAWHKSAGFFRKTVVVGDTGAEVKFVIPITEKDLRTIAQR
ncbi:MAG: hypothetical protein JO307_24140 [Bryobacterales bacterium]|nr:hypothetical protein [Bryobacterales bacterium]MBV9398994.1 hypothetical protein [Bryobacterales bacterium]